MARAKKDGKFLNCYISKKLMEKLDIYSKSTRIPKTAIVEKALAAYLDESEMPVNKKPFNNSTNNKED